MDIEKLLEALEAAATQWGMKGIGVLLAVLAGWAVANLNRGEIFDGRVSTLRDGVCTLG